MVQAQGGEIRYVEHPEFLRETHLRGEVHWATEDDFYLGWIPQKLVWQQDFWVPVEYLKDAEVSAGIPEKENWRYREKRRIDCHSLAQEQIEP